MIRTTRWIERLVLALCLFGLFFFACVVARAAESAQGCTGRMPARYELRDALVFDRQTGLTWMRCPVGSRWQDRHCQGSPGFFSHGDAVAVARTSGGGWRLPSAAELAGLITNRCAGLAIDAEVFPDIEAADPGEGARFWASDAFVPGMFYVVEFTYGYVDANTENYPFPVRLVKWCAADPPVPPPGAAG